MAVLLEAVAHAAARRLSTWATEAAHVARCIFDEDSPYGGGLWPWSTPSDRNALVRYWKRGTGALSSTARASVA